SWVVQIWGLVLTACTLLWAITFVDRFFRYVQVGSASTTFYAIGVAGCAVFAWAILWFRPATIALQEKCGYSPAAESRYPVSRALRVLHAVVVALVIGLVAKVKPAQDTANIRECAWWTGDNGTCLIYANDWPARTMLLSLAVAVGILIAFVGMSAISTERTWADTDANPLLGSGILIVASTAVLHLAWAVFGFALSRTLAYLDLVGMPGVEFKGGYRSKSAYALMIVDDGNPEKLHVHGAELAMLVVGLPFLAFGTAIMVWLLYKKVASRMRKHGGSDLDRRVERARLIHRLICLQSGFKLSVSAIAVVLVGNAISLACMCLLSRTTELDGESGWVTVAVILQHLLVIGALVLAVFSRIRAPLAVMGDILGFFPPRSHPFAGFSYRPTLLAAIDRQCAAHTGPLALVGHSQGSIAAFWYTSSQTSPSRKLHLVTCGSPLVSLYARFFPQQFDKTRFERARAETRTHGWANFWRETDPISTEVGIAGDECLTDPSEQGASEGLLILRGHSDYWSEPKQRERIALDLGSAASEGSD
ncbi:MAG: hypothetical protein ACRDWY_15250, partial [Actinomycetes bacterium]